MNLAKQYAEGTLVVTDTLDFLRKATFGAVFGGGYRPGTTNYFEELVSTGRLELIQSDSIRHSIMDFYSRIDVYQNRSVVHSSDYLGFTNGLRPFNSDDPGFISPYDQKELMLALKTEAARVHIDKELSYTYQVRGYIRNLNRIAENVVRMISEELPGQ